MFKDWLICSVLSLLLVLEVGGWAWLFNQYLFSRGKTLLPSSLSTALSLVLGSQVHFLFSWFGLTQGWLHLLLLAVGASAFLYEQSHASIHFTLARLLSPLTWKRDGFWIALPVLWLILKWIDLLVPHADSASLSGSLLIAATWFRDRGHLLNPIEPAGLFGSYGDAWIFHILAILKAVSSTPRSALARTQVVSQLFIFWEGPCLAILLLGEAFSDLLRQTPLGKYQKHHLDRFVPLAYAATAVGAATASMVVVGPLWLAIAELFGAVAFCLRGRPLLAAFLAGAALATDPGQVFFVSLVLIGIAAYLGWRRQEFRMRSVAFLPLSFAAGIGLWALRNRVVTGNALFPAFSRPLGWFTESSPWFGWPKPHLSPFLTLVVFASITLLASRLSGSWHKRKDIRLALRTGWVFAALFLLRPPFHVLWQNLGVARQSMESYLTRYHQNYAAKAWAGVYLPSSEKVVWSGDHDGFYMEQASATTADSAPLRDALIAAKSPSAKASTLCSLGYRYLAWEEYRHGEELDGVASWLELQEGTFIQSVNEVHFFDIASVCQRPL